MTAYIRKGKKKVSARRSGVESGASKSLHHPGEMLPENVEQRRHELQRFALAPGRKVRAINTQGRQYLGLFSRTDPKTGTFFMKGSKDRFDPRNAEIEIQRDDLVTKGNTRALYLVMEILGPSARLGHQEELVPLDQLKFVRTLTSGFVADDPAGTPQE